MFNAGELKAEKPHSDTLSEPLLSGQLSVHLCKLRFTLLIVVKSAGPADVHMVHTSLGIQGWDVE